MTTHRVRQGECFVNIAAQHGFTDWEVVYRHGENATEHPDPHVLEPGTTVEIPDHEWFDGATSRTHRFKVKRVPTLLQIRLEDEKRNPWQGKRYELTVGGRKFEGTTPKNGLVEHEVDAHECSGRLRLWIDDEDDPVVMQVKIGHLDPKEMATGVQARLNNLDYDCGEVDGDVAMKTKLALEQFQLDHGLPVSGEPDPTTCEKLAALSRA